MAPILPTTSLPRRAALVAALAAGALAFGGPARADDGEGGAESVEQQIRAQMDKIVKLMKENEKAILDASRGAGGKPVAVEVGKPEAPDAKKNPPPGPGEEPKRKPDGAAGTDPAARGEEVRRRMDELLRKTQEGGGSIPKELEDLVKMIPT